MTKTKRNNGVMYGFLTGGCMILFTFLLYLCGIGPFMGKSAYLGYIILIGLAAAGCLAERKAGGGELSFLPALKTTFTIFVIALACQTLFTWILLNFIDTHFRDTLTQASLVKDAQVMKWFGMSDDAVAHNIAERRGERLFSLSDMTLALAFSYIMYFLIALLIAAVVKKKKTE